MTVSAHDVAEILRSRLPGLPVKKLHKLLYYCQGHHLAAFDEPLFSETITAWDRGPVVGTLWFREKHAEDTPPHSELTEAQLNTIGYVLSRYGALTGMDLEHLSHSESPWQTANARRPAGQSARIEQSWLRDYFSTEGAAGADQDDLPLDADAVADWLREADERRGGPTRPDSRAELRQRLASRV